MRKLKSPLRGRQRASYKRDGYRQSNGFDVSMNHYTPIYINKRSVGEVHGDLFVKYVKESDHFYRKRRAWCFDVSSLEDAIRYGARWVELHEQKIPQTFRAAIATIFDEGIDVDEGQDKQIRLPLTYWSCGNEPNGEQLGLWEVRDV